MRLYGSTVQKGARNNIFVYFKVRDIIGPLKDYLELYLAMTFKINSKFQLVQF